jgi:hypothetical protein
MSALYVYAFTDAPVRPLRIGRERLEAVQLEGLYVIASRLASAPVLSEEALQRQHRAVERIAGRADAVLPARFGSLVELDELRRIVQLRGDALRAGLGLVRGRRQMTTRLLGPRGRGGAGRPSAATGTAYLRARMRLDPETAGAIDALRRAMGQLVVAERVEPGKEATAAAVYHLIAIGDDERYREIAAGVAGSLKGRVIRVSGPWPAFAFTPELLA